MNGGDILHKLSEKNIAAIWKEITAIIERGNDAVVRKKGGGYIVFENKKTIRYSTQ